MASSSGDNAEVKEVTKYFGSKAYYSGELLKDPKYEHTLYKVYYSGELLKAGQVDRGRTTFDWKKELARCIPCDTIFSKDQRYKYSKDLATLTVTLEGGDKVTMWSYAVDVRDSEDPERELPERGFNEEEDYVLFHYTDEEAMDGCGNVEAEAARHAAAQAAAKAKAKADHFTSAAAAQITTAFALLVKSSPAISQADAEAARREAEADAEEARKWRQYLQRSRARQPASRAAPAAAAPRSGARRARRPTAAVRGTPLHRAAFHGHTAVALLLLEHRASLEARDAWGPGPRKGGGCGNFLRLLEVGIVHRIGRSFGSQDGF
eukprot:Skav210123  [mRNA]  locus=scaffold2194:202880:206551:+ [translate_table: standard]